MRFETPSAVKKEEHYSLDDPWYERFKAIANISPLDLMEGDPETEEKQRKFLSGEIDTPEFSYPRLENFGLEKREKALLELKHTIRENETNETLRQVYTWKLNEKIAEIRMLEATRDGNDRKFLKYSTFLYGEPNQEVFQYTLSQLKDTVDKKLFNENSEINQTAQRLNTKLFAAFLSNESTINPQEAGFKKPKSTKEDRQYTAEEIKEAFERALEKYEITGWEIVIDTETKKTGVSTNQEKKTIVIPHTRRIKETYLESLIEHEIGTHALRRESGERSKLKLLGLGLDRYLPGEEGVATYKEQEIEGARNYSGFEGHLAISLARGLDGKKRNFREVFEILQDYYFITSSNKDTKEAWKSARNSAWSRCVRTFRGTTGQASGVCFTKDIVYREGNIGVWNVVKTNPEEEKRFTVGKYDPNNPRHIWIMEQLGINEEDLEQLEK